ncbi:MAG: carbamoyltransferase HypF [Pseudomonadota bacterium]
MATQPTSLLQDVERVHIAVRGAVQGVGFRPFLWNAAQDLGLSGWARNTSDGVEIELEGLSIAQFLGRLNQDAPPLARIDDIQVKALPPEGSDGFKLRSSEAKGAVTTCITPDMATCDDCLADISDPTNARFGYAFTNCTNCGPRYTITKALPYDRAQTSMADFEMCAPCQTEYDDPADRRFHAQPNACPDCGPQLSHSIADIKAALQSGQIVALKGLGGFHLVVDATNEAAVATLRQRKARDAKPFAIMVADRWSALSFAEMSPAEQAALIDQRRPIVICKARAGAIAPSVSAGLPTIGIMLPYTPLQHLLFMGENVLPALVMTSANLSGQPLVVDNEEAEEKLGYIADLIVTYNRDIVVRCDDSVVRVIDGAPAIFRRARGYVPAPIKLAHEVPPILAVGAHLKNTICITRGDEAFVSQHIGDLEDLSVADFFEETIAHLTSLLDVTPEAVACDLHPDFLSTRHAEQTGLPVIKVQHHHAHIASVMAEHRLAGPCLGLALDGFGLGGDGASSWGGELLKVDAAGFDRLGALAPLAQPGGDAAARAPWRMAAAVFHALGRSTEIAEQFDDQSGADVIQAMLERNINAPETSSAGRLFDAACGLLGVKATASYEGEAPMFLEGLVTKPEIMPDGWTVDADGRLSLLPLLEALIGCDPERGANLFHGTLIAALVDWTIVRTDAPSHVALSGGCLQNRVLAEGLVRGFKAHGIETYLPRQVPANDGGLSLGQAWVAAQTLTTAGG